MASKIIFKKIRFNNIDVRNFDKCITKKGLFVFPAGPGLASIQKSNEYYKSIQKADLVFFDSGFFVLLLKIFKNVKVKKFSGYKFLGLFFEFSKSNKSFLKNLGLKKIHNYIAPKYNSSELADKKLLSLINKVKPNFILINIGGGTQEVLGLYLKKKLKFKPTILCTGAAISFFTKDQAPINNFIDKYYLGWLLRLIFNPLIFFKRYIFGLKLIPMVIFNKVKILN